MEGLSYAIDKASGEGQLQGCKISRTASSVSHLLFADDSFLFFKGTVEEATNVKALLINYEKCSGQSVNFQKSGVFFSANIRRDLQHQISNVLEVHNDLSNTKYLVLPSLVGRSKKQVFGFLKDKVSAKIQTWQPKPISRAGKSILVRNIAQAIPAFTMSCFFLPKTLCQELERKFNNYWWSSGKTDRRGLNWLSWKNMS